MAYEPCLSQHQALPLPAPASIFALASWFLLPGIRGIPQARFPPSSDHLPKEVLIVSHCRPLLADSLTPRPLPTRNPIVQGFCCGWLIVFKVESETETGLELLISPPLPPSSKD